MSQERREQLEMLWPEDRLDDPPRAATPPGYSLRTYRRGDEPAFAYLMERASLGEWNAEKIDAIKTAVLPEGWFFVVQNSSGAAVSTAQAGHHPAPRHPFGGELGWVATDPAHRGRSLAAVATVAALRRFLEAGYARIYLKTDDFRIPAVRLYLKLGFVPYLFSDDMRERWKSLADGLGFDYTPELWPGEPATDGRG
jgi:mycothiol synthase